MIPLPIDAAIPSILEALRAARTAVLTAPPGAGKTTRVAPAILRAGLLLPSRPALAMLQPRRVAARASAERIAHENGWTLGREVGYHIRFERKLSNDTHLRIMTEGILTRQLLADPFMEGVGGVILDEFHERHLDTDLAIAFLKEIRQTVRPDLLILVMSATIDADPVARFLGDCPVIHSEGRTFPVEVRYTTSATIRELPGRIADVLVEECRSAADSGSSTGHILVFLPGMDEIRRTMKLLEPLSAVSNADVFPLHGSLSNEEQHRALAPSARRKIILSTNIAETSLTIDGVRMVIDGGYARVARYDERRGLDRLDLERISRASADQRAGRAGRTAPGVAIRLWSQKEHHALAEFAEPDIRRVDLAGTVLALHAWGSADPLKFGWYETPRGQAIESAGQLLQMLGAVKKSEAGRAELTPLGRRMLRLPLHPRIARLLLAAAEVGMLEEGCAAAALLSEKDILPRHGERAGTAGDSDLAYRLRLLDSDERSGEGRVDAVALRQVLRTTQELMRIGRTLGHDPQRAGAARGKAILRALLLAYPDRVCRRRENDPESAAIVGGGAVRLARESVVRRAEFFLALDARHDPASPTRQAIVHLASAIELCWLEELFSGDVVRRSETIYDSGRDRVIGVSRLYYRDLLLREDVGAAVDPDRAATLLMEAVGPRAEEIFRSDPAADQLLNRIAFSRKHGLNMELSILSILESIIPGKRSVEQLKQADLGGVLAGAMPHATRRTLDREAPASLALPSGRQWRLTYSSDGSPPVLAVKLQELFGLQETPRLAGGRVPVLLHLLAPNGRPVQITDDLASFWKNTYPRVRKDLRARYPKHKWPEIPE